MKFFALLLFTAGFVAPVMMTGASVRGEEDGHLQVKSYEIPQNLFSIILLEELNENEEEKDGHKVIDYDNNSFQIELHHISFDIHRVDDVAYLNSVQQSKALPALFQVYRELII
jgi:hypothetical protein